MGDLRNPKNVPFSEGISFDTRPTAPRGATERLYPTWPASRISVRNTEEEMRSSAAPARVLPILQPLKPPPGCSILPVSVLNLGHEDSLIHRKSNWPVFTKAQVMAKIARLPDDPRFPTKVVGPTKFHIFPFLPSITNNFPSFRIFFSSAS